AYRDDSKAQPEMRRAANTAIDAIDNAMVALGRLRAELVGQIRVSDDAAMARTDKLLADLRAERAQRERYEREDPETGAPLPPGVEGFRPGGARCPGSGWPATCPRARWPAARPGRRGRNWCTCP